MAIGKFIKSLDLAAAYGEKLVTFSIHRWDTALINSSEVEVNRSYLDAYRRYYASGNRPIGIAEGYYVRIRPVKSDAALTLNPYAHGGLTDGLTADSEDWSRFKGIGSPDLTPFVMEIRFDDPVQIRRVVSTYLDDASAAIALPKMLKYDYLIRSGEKQEVFSYTQFYVDTFSNTAGSQMSAAALDAPTVADGIRITVFPGAKWTFLDEIWVE